MNTSNMVNALSAVKRKTRTIKMADAVVSRRIRGPGDWEAARDQLDAAVRAALSEVDEVELR